MTIREFVKTHNLNLNYKDRAKIGQQFKSLEFNFKYVPERDYFVRDYEDGFFEREDVQLLILKYMTNG